MVKKKLAGAVTIPKEDYYRLKLKALKLEMLENGGVDNWTGYSDALYPQGETGFADREDQILKELIDG